MRPNPSSQVVNVGNESENVKLGLDLSAAAHLISVLTDLYSNPVAAVIREYSTNALDSHIEAGNKAPIEVTLPTAANPHLIIRDFGLGLSVNGIRDTYALYGASTKRESDDVNGMLGLGCKSALTYSPSFNITSVHEGVKILATVVKDIDGVGVIKILDTLSSDEPNGVEISIPVKPYDISKFADEAAKFFYNWKKGTILLNGEEPNSIWDDGKLIWLDDDIAVEPNAGYGSQHYIVQHNVAYPTLIEGLSPKIRITAFVPIGSVNFTPSREALHHTPRTKETLKQLKDYINGNLMRVLEEKANKGATPWERAKIASNWAAVLHQQFKGINLHIRAPSTYSIFWARVQGGWGRVPAYSKEQTISVHNIVDEQKVMIVTGYNLRTITQLAKLRLQDYRDTHGYKGAALLPDGCDGVELLEGRKNVIPWEKIKAETEHVKVKTVREKRDETTYACRQGTKDLGALTLKEIADLGLPVTYGINTIGSSGHFPEVVTVSIQMVSLTRILKKFPDAVEIWQYQKKRIAEERAKLKGDDLVYLAARKDSVIRILHGAGVQASQVDDPLLKSGLKAYSTPSPALNAYTNVGGDLHSVAAPATFAGLEKRYPLLMRMGHLTSNYKADMLVYLNAKYRSLQPKV